MGRPYEPEVGDAICAAISCGMTIQKALASIRNGPNMVQFYQWQRESPDFARAYDIARECKADTLVEQALGLADDCSDESNSAVNKARLQVDTRKWIAGRFAPKRYGDRIEHTGEMTHNYVSQPIPVEQRNSDRAVARTNGSAANGHSA